MTATHMQRVVLYVDADGFGMKTRNDSVRSVDIFALFESELVSPNGLKKVKIQFEASVFAVLTRRTEAEELLVGTLDASVCIQLRTSLNYLNYFQVGYESHSWCECSVTEARV